MSNGPLWRRPPSIVRRTITPDRHWRPRLRTLRLVLPASVVAAGLACAGGARAQPELDHQVFVPLVERRDRVLATPSPTTSPEPVCSGLIPAEAGGFESTVGWEMLGEGVSHTSGDGGAWVPFRGRYFVQLRPGRGAPAIVRFAAVDLPPADRLVTLTMRYARRWTTRDQGNPGDLLMVMLVRADGETGNGLQLAGDVSGSASAEWGLTTQSATRWAQSSGTRRAQLLLIGEENDADPTVWGLDAVELEVCVLP